MPKARTDTRRPGNNKITRLKSRIVSTDPVDHAITLIETICCLAGADHLIGDRNDAETDRLRRAIERKDTPDLFDRLVEAFSLQGIGDHAAYVYMDRHGRPAWRDLARTTARPPACSKLRGYWAFHGCGYRKDARTCAEPEILPACPLPRHALRNGRLNQTAYSLFLFISDIAGGDLVGWIDGRLEQACSGSAGTRPTRMRNALIEPMRHLFGVSDKVLSMALADLLLAAPSTKPLWLEAGAAMIAIDTLVHNFLHRTGILGRLKAQHTYGPACYGPNGCADVIARVARRIDAREFNPRYPRAFPRFVQHAVWRYCAQRELDICNGNRIDDRHRCGNGGCPLFHLCDRVALKPRAPH